MESAEHNVLIPFQHVISNAYNAYASAWSFHLKDLIIGC